MRKRQDHQANIFPKNKPDGNGTRMNIEGNASSFEKETLEML